MELPRSLWSRMSGLVFAPKDSGSTTTTVTDIPRRADDSTSGLHSKFTEEVTTTTWTVGKAI